MTAKRSQRYEEAMGNVEQQFSFIPICTQHAAAVKSQDRDDDRKAAREEQCSNAFGL
jgi:hypothetical protein